MLRKCAILSLCLISIVCAGQSGSEVKILTNQVGYEAIGPKHAVVQGKEADRIWDCAVKNETNGKEVFSAPAKVSGHVDKWRDWNYWTFDFEPLATEGTYYVECATGTGAVRSYPFLIQTDLLERNTLSNAIYYFKEERSSGLMDQADRHAPFDPPKTGTLDAHGGWWDATGDYGKHLSHLSFSTYFNPQQIPLVVYNAFKSEQQLQRRGNPYSRRYQDRLLDEAMFGADYLVRVKDPEGSFYRSIGSEPVNQLPQGRRVAGEMKQFGIFKSKDTGPRDMVEKAANDREYEVSYRSGGGVAIAALAIASTFPFSGEFGSSDYRKAAEDAFVYLEKNNPAMTNDGKENIVDDFCALMAASELFRATHKPEYQAAADRRAGNLIARLISRGDQQNYWRADDGDRPFFHASDAGLPVVSLLYYAEIADGARRDQVIATVKKSLQHELAVTAEVNNPFGYARQYVQDKTGRRRTSFFFPHNSDAAPWWQGENARLASLASAALLAAPHCKDDPAFQKALIVYADNQLNWILGLNPFDSSMMNGVGRNNPHYMFFDSWEFTNAPGGISNGITSGFGDENDIDYNLTYRETGADNDWRWSEQWLPHGAWYMLAASAQGATR